MTTGPRPSECQCALCGATFTGLSLFDAHQDVNYRRRPPIICRPPDGLGLAQGPGGTWGTREGLAWRARQRTAMAEANSAKAPQ